MVSKGPSLNGTRLPVNQILLLGCWHLPIISSPCFFVWIFCKSGILSMPLSNSKHPVDNFVCPRLVCHVFGVLFLVLSEHVFGMVVLYWTEIMIRSFLFIRRLLYIEEASFPVCRWLCFLCWYVLGVALGGGAQNKFFMFRWQAMHLVCGCLSLMQLSSRQYWCY